MPTVQGIFNSVQIPADQAKKSFASYITRLAPNGQSPLFGLTSMLKSETALQTEHGYWSKTMIFPQFQVSAAGQTSGDTVFTVADTSQLIPGQIHRITSTGENVIINQVISATSVQVTRTEAPIA